MRTTTDGSGCGGTGWIQWLPKWHRGRRRPLSGTENGLVRRVELRGLEPLTPTLPVWCATSCATAPRPARSLYRLDVRARGLASDGLAAEVVRAGRGADERAEAGVVPLQPPAEVALDEDRPAGVAERRETPPGRRLELEQLAQRPTRGAPVGHADHGRAG